MKNTIHLLYFLLLILRLSACTPQYEVTPANPETETSASDAPYNLDFVEMNNEIIEEYQSEDHTKIFPFITNLEVDGNNDAKSIDLTLSVTENTSDEAIIKVMSDLTIQLSNEARTQDFRFSHPTGSDFGSFYSVYSYHYSVSRGDNVVIEETINPGDEIPFDPTQDFDTIVNEITSENNSDAVE